MKNFYRFCLCSVIISFTLATLVCTLPQRAEYVSVEKEDFIKWVDFNVTYNAMADCLEYDIATNGTEKHTSWIKLLAYLAATGGGNFNSYKKSALKKVTDAIDSGKTIEELSKNVVHYPYYFEAYSAVLDGFVGEYEIEKDDGAFEKKYG